MVLGDRNFPQYIYVVYKHVKNVTAKFVKFIQAGHEVIFLRFQLGYGYFPFCIFKMKSIILFFLTVIHM